MIITETRVLDAHTHNLFISQKYQQRKSFIIKQVLFGGTRDVIESWAENDVVAELHVGMRLYLTMPLWSVPDVSGTPKVFGIPLDVPMLIGWHLGGGLQVSFRQMFTVVVNSYAHRDSIVTAALDCEVMNGAS